MSARSGMDSSIISEEIRDEVDMTQSMMIADEIGTMSAKPGMVSYQSMSRATATNNKV